MVPTQSSRCSARGSRQIRKFQCHADSVAESWNEKLAAATRFLANVDPIGLISDGCPEDEYAAEAEELLKSREQLTSQTVQTTFLRWFGAQIGEAAANEIAEGVAVIRAR